MMFLRKKNRHPSTPYLWKEETFFNGKYEEYRHFHGLTREWGRISQIGGKFIEWNYVYYHPFRTLKHSVGTCENVNILDETLPLWFIRKMQHAVLDMKTDKQEWRNV